VVPRRIKPSHREDCRRRHSIRFVPLLKQVKCGGTEQTSAQAGNQSPRRLVPRGERQQGDIASLLDGARETALVRGANTGEPPRDDLSALGHKALQQADIAVGYRVNLLGAELADLLAAEKLSAAAGTAGWPGTRSAGGWPSAGAGWTRTRTRTGPGFRSG